MSGVINNSPGMRSGGFDMNNGIRDSLEAYITTGSYTFDRGSSSYGEEVFSAFRLTTPRPGRYMFYCSARIVNDGDQGNFGRVRLGYDASGGTSWTVIMATEQMVHENYSGGTFGAGLNHQFGATWANISVTNYSTHWTLMATSSNTNDVLRMYSDSNGNSRFGFVRTGAI